MILYSILIREGHVLIVGGAIIEGSTCCIIVRAAVVLPHTFQPTYY